MNVKSWGKCPKCEQLITQITAGHVTISIPGGDKWNGISYTCPHCQTILSVQIDPIAIKNDLIKELLNRLRQGV
jgi:phage FluMu protein Com